jgi:hypothetical protein
MASGQVPDSGKFEGSAMISQKSANDGNSLQLPPFFDVLYHIVDKHQHEDDRPNRDRDEENQRKQRYRGDEEESSDRHDHEEIA